MTGKPKFIRQGDVVMWFDDHKGQHFGTVLDGSGDPISFTADGPQDPPQVLWADRRDMALADDSDPVAVWRVTGMPYQGDAGKQGVPAGLDPGSPRVPAVGDIVRYQDGNGVYCQGRICSLGPVDPPVQAQICDLTIRTDGTAQAYLVPNDWPRLLVKTADLQAPTGDRQWMDPSLAKQGLWWLDSYGKALWLSGPDDDGSCWTAPDAVNLPPAPAVGDPVVIMDVCTGHEIARAKITSIILGHGDDHGWAVAATDDGQWWQVDPTDLSRISAVDWMPGTFDAWVLNDVRLALDSNRIQLDLGTRPAGPSTAAHPYIGDVVTWFDDNSCLHWGRITDLDVARDQFMVTVPGSPTGVTGVDSDKLHPAGMTQVDGKLVPTWTVQPAARLTQVDRLHQVMAAGRGLQLFATGFRGDKYTWILQDGADYGLVGGAHCPICGAAQPAMVVTVAGGWTVKDGTKDLVCCTACGWFDYWPQMITSHLGRVPAGMVDGLMAKYWQALGCSVGKGVDDGI